MNSLVVFLSVVALAVAKPSGLAYEAGILPYSAPFFAAAAPAAVSSQSRLDIKSSPAVVATAAYAPARAVIAQPAVYAAPAVATAAIAPAITYSGGSAVSSQSRLDIKTTPAVTSTVVSAPAVAYSAPAVATPAIAFSAPAVAAVAAPAVAYSAPAVTYTGGSAVSSQSRLDIKTTPAVTSTVVSAPAVAYSAPALAYSAPAVGYSAPAVAYSAPSVAYSAPAVAYSAPAAYATGIVKTAYAAPTVFKTAAFAPAAIATTAAIAAPSVPLDTPEVIAARAAHFEAKALAGAHLIHKRSVAYAAPIFSAPIATTYSATPLLSSYHAAPLAYSAPLALSTPLITKAYSVHPW